MKSIIRQKWYFVEVFGCNREMRNIKTISYKTINIFRGMKRPLHAYLCVITSTKFKIHWYQIENIVRNMTTLQYYWKIRCNDKKNKYVRGKPWIKVICYWNIYAEILCAIHIPKRVLICWKCNNVIYLNIYILLTITMNLNIWWYSYISSHLTLPPSVPLIRICLDTGDVM